MKHKIIRKADNVTAIIIGEGTAINIWTHSGSINDPPGSKVLRVSVVGKVFDSITVVQTKGVKNEKVRSTRVRRNK